MLISLCYQKETSWKYPHSFLENQDFSSRAYTENQRHPLQKSKIFRKGVFLVKQIDHIIRMRYNNYDYIFRCRSSKDFYTWNLRKFLDKMKLIPTKVSCVKEYFAHWIPKFWCPQWEHDEGDLSVKIKWVCQSNM